jgi:hypothetical protein
MTIERLIGFAAGTILFGIGTVIGNFIVKKMEENFTEIKKTSENAGIIPAAVK